MFSSAYFSVPILSLFLTLVEILWPLAEELLFPTRLWRRWRRKTKGEKTKIHRLDIIAGPLGPECRSLVLFLSARLAHPSWEIAVVEEEKSPF
jgi:hypothetical protein